MSIRVEDQTSDDWDLDEGCLPEGHRMVSIKVASPAVPFIERCEICGFIEPSALTAHAENWLKQTLPRRAQRIAVAVETDPFRFVQPSDGNLTFKEILLQTFAAMTNTVLKERESDGKRETDIFKATLAEAERALEKSWERGYAAAESDRKNRDEGDH